MLPTFGHTPQIPMKHSFQITTFFLFISCFACSPAQGQSIATQASASQIQQQYAAYNLWANRQLSDWLMAAPADAWTKEIESSFNTLEKTALHIWSAEYLWLQVLLDQPYDDNPTKNFDGAPKDLVAGWLQASIDFAGYVKQLDEESISGSRGSGSDRPPLAVTDIIQHCMNHSTYHRGQLITMGRQAGLPPPPQTDFIYYVRSQH